MEIRSRVAIGLSKRYLQSLTGLTEIDLKIKALKKSKSLKKNSLKNFISSGLKGTYMFP